MMLRTVLVILLGLNPYLFAAEQAAEVRDPVDFSSDDTYADQTEALRSRRYVHRAVLSNAIKETTVHFNVKRPYINHMLGFNNVWQREFIASKYVSGYQGVAVGYIFEKGHGLEIEFDVSSNSSLQFAYKYFVLPSPYSAWPFIGGGLGMEITGLAFGGAPPEMKKYSGMRQKAFASFGVVIPLIDVGLKVEVRAEAYGTARLVLVTGLGAILFL